MKKNGIRVARKCKLGPNVWEQEGYPDDLYVEGTVRVDNCKFTKDLLRADAGGQK